MAQVIFVSLLHAQGTRNGIRCFVKVQAFSFYILHQFWGYYGREKIIGFGDTLCKQSWYGFNFQKLHQIQRVFSLKTFPLARPSEIRLCALLRLNFASKEIAAIMGISPDSVKVARYRLRKKLELTRNDSLVDFIRNM